MEQELHSKQRDILGCIRKYHDDYGISPSIRDLSEMTEITLSVVHYHLDQLVELGYIKRNKHKARGLVLVK
jgi:DNA-binding MarR family transcriptional regulator